VAERLSCASAYGVGGEALVEQQMADLTQIRQVQVARQVSGTQTL
jgi:hypothetical protein